MILVLHDLLVVQVEHLGVPGQGLALLEVGVLATAFELPLVLLLSLEQQWCWDVILVAASAMSLQLLLEVLQVSPCEDLDCNLLL